MSDDDDDNLFAESDADSDDTNELIASSRSAASTKKAAAAKKPDNNDEDSDDDGGLFDSDSDEEEETPRKQKTLQKASPASGLSKRERLEALAKKKKGTPEHKASPNDKTESGYQSGDSYDSADFQRTKEDDDFLDTTGEDADAVNELYADQHFEDERPDREAGKKKVKKRRHRDDEAIEDNGNGEPDNPIMAAVHRMKKKRREKKSFPEVEEECKAFLGRMEAAAEEDETAVSQRRPALQKLGMLSEVVDMLTRRDMQRMLLDLDLLIVCRRWIQPLPNGTLGNVTVRQKLLEAIANMTGESGISANDLKRSGLGKTVMVLFKHRSETPAMKRQLKKLIEQWSRPIFRKSGDMRDLERVQQSRGEGGLAAVSRQQQAVARLSSQQAARNGKKNSQDLDSLIASGKKGGGESGVNRVRVPFSKGFHFSVRPAARDDVVGSPEQQQQRKPKDNRDKLSKRMVEKGRAVSKNQRSANISIEGRPTK